MACDHFDFFWWRHNQEKNVEKVDNLAATARLLKKKRVKQKKQNSKQNFDSE